MPCYHPLDAKLAPSGKPIFRRHENFGRFAKLIKLPCGRCIGCRLDRSKTWAIRLMHEAQSHIHKSFITLTYRNEFLASRRTRWEPAVPYTPPSDLQPGDATEDKTRARAETCTHADSLSKRDAQLFTKRLNESLRTKKLGGVRYYLVGEYGEQTQRPHYHAAIYGEDFTDDRYEWKHTESGATLWRSSRLEQLWPHGDCYIGELTFKSAAYIARYITKKITGAMADEHYKRTAPDGSNYWIEPEFAHMSRRPGIGKDWFDKFATDVYPNDYCVIDGKKLKPPRFYDKQMEALKFYELLLGGEPTIDRLKKEREEKNLDSAADNTPARLRAKEAVAKAKLGLNKRNLE